MQKFVKFGENKNFGNFLRAYFAFGKIFNLLWAQIYAFGLSVIVVKGQN